MNQAHATETNTSDWCEDTKPIAEPGMDVG